MKQLVETIHHSTSSKTQLNVYVWENTSTKGTHYTANVAGSYYEIGDNQIPIRIDYVNKDFIPKASSLEAAIKLINNKLKQFKYVEV